jgi:hypothetical protein
MWLPLRRCVTAWGPVNGGTSRKVGRNRYLVIAPTAEGRYLELIYRDLPEALYVFHAAKS